MRIRRVLGSCVVVLLPVASLGAAVSDLMLMYLFQQGSLPWGSLRRKRNG